MFCSLACVAVVSVVSSCWVTSLYLQCREAVAAPALLLDSAYHCLSSYRAVSQAISLLIVLIFGGVQASKCPQVGISKTSLLELISNFLSLLFFPGMYQFY